MTERNAFERQLADEIEYEVGSPRPVDALRITQQAQATTPRWRFNEMSSTLKFTAAASVLAAAAAAFLLIVPGGTGPEGVVSPPGAEQASPSPDPSPEPSPIEMPTGAGPVAGELLNFARLQVAGTEETADDVTEGRGLVLIGDVMKVDDARLNGTVTRALNWTAQPSGDGGEVAFETNAWRIENAGGAWAGQGTAMAIGASETYREVDTVVLEGTGDYDGLTANLLVEWTADGTDVQGAIFVGEAPPFPELPEAE